MHGRYWRTGLLAICLGSVVQTQARTEARQGDADGTGPAELEEILSSDPDGSGPAESVEEVPPQVALNYRLRDNMILFASEVRQGRLSGLSGGDLRIGIGAPRAVIGSIALSL